MGNTRFQYMHVLARTGDGTATIQSRVTECDGAGETLNDRSMLGQQVKSYDPLASVSAYHSPGQPPQFFHYEATARCKFYFF